MPAPRAASCFAKEAVRQGRPEPPPLPFRSHPSPRLRQIKGGGLQSHQASRVQEFLMGGEEYGGRETSRIPSGTTKFGSVCQPALSSSSTMMRSRPAPASRANSASSAAKNGLDTPFEMDQKVSPEIGWTKAVTYNHLYRWWPSAIGRWPLGAHTRRRIGFSPMRCSSVAQTSTGVSGCFAASSATTVASFFKRLALLGRGRGRMARARLLHRPVDRLERLPAALRQDRSEPEFARHPGRHFPA